MTSARVEILARDRSSIYLRRAENMLQVMEVADQAGNPDGIVTNAIQAGIALGDAYTVALVQRRSRGQDHSEVLLLIRECPAPNAREVGRLLQGILNRRSEILYESHDVSIRRAREIATLARKLHSAVRSAVPASRPGP